MLVWSTENGDIWLLLYLLECSVQFATFFHLSYKNMVDIYSSMLSKSGLYNIYIGNHTFDNPFFLKVAKK